MVPSENNTLIVLIEDNPQDADRIRAALEEIKDASFRLQTIGGMSTALARAAGGGIDLVLLSLSCAGDQESSKLANFHKLRACAPQVPVLVLSEPREEELALRMIHEGAQDYFVKGAGPSDGVVRFVRSALERNRNRKRAEVEVRLGPAPNRAIGKIISFVGAKGGVGTSTVALNIAARLALEGTVIAVEATSSRGLFSQYFRHHSPAVTLADLLREGPAPDGEKIRAALRPCLAVPNLHGLLARVAQRNAQTAPRR